MIHTGFYDIEGTFKYRQMMLYGMRESSQWKYLDQLQLNNNQEIFIQNDLSLTLNQLIDKSKNILTKYKVDSQSNVIISGENRSLLGFAFGLANSLINNTQIVMTGNMSLQSVNQIIKWHHNAIWIVED